MPLPGGAIAGYANATTLTPTKPNYDAAFAPFGEPYASSHIGNIFAGMEQVVAADEYETPIREYHTAQGRWISPDPAGLNAVDPSNPQTWNRYAYVMNNPLSNIDPTGLLRGLPSSEAKKSRPNVGRLKLKLS